ncbi:MAG: TIGR03960 family B12-binding radical SAM protein [Candidatus Omnitrophica bacterium]|nr:TIGR03960 family B12-binding radical SAM protein [Candidatus Omnitrophota bacterium]
MDKLNELLLTVQKPGRYVGGEWNAVKKEWTADKVKFLLAFPDVYEIGMSNLGMKILYGILNGRDDCLAERVFSPWPDFAAVLKNNGISLFSLESRKALKDFDIIGFSLSYELGYTNVLNILDLGGVAKKSSERTGDEPLVIAGGPACFNPEPMAEFIDAFVIGDGEEVIGEIVEVYKVTRSQSHQVTRKEALRALAKIKGVYVPSLYKVDYNADFTIKAFTPSEAGVPALVDKRVTMDLEKAFYPAGQIVPNIQIVHDRIAIEIMRGCKHACSFCQAQAIYRPCRERSKECVLRLARESYEKTGHDEVSLLSLSSVDHSGLKEIVEGLNCDFAGKAVSVSVPSLRIEDALKNIPALVSKVKKAGLTFAPEAGSERVRKAINKNIDIDRLFAALSESFRAGWRHVKLYFMIGLPQENEEDVLKIAELIYNVSDARKEVDGKCANVTASINSFIPKPHTSLERVPMDDKEVLEKKKSILREAMRSKFVELDFHSFDMSHLEAAFARGDRRLGEVIFEAWKKGARFDGWQDRFNSGLWAESFAAMGIDPRFYANRQRGPEEILPWKFIRL